MAGSGLAHAPLGASIATWSSFIVVPLVASVMVQQGLYRQVPTSFMLLLAVVALVVAVAVAASRKWSHVPAIVAAAAGILFIHYCGPANAAAFVLLVLSALALGSLFDGRGTWPVALRLLAGIALVVAVVGWLLPFPLHGGRTYLLVAAAACWWRRGHLARDLRLMAGSWRQLEQDAPGWLLLAIGSVFVAGLGLWLPSLNYDDNSAHLILPYQLLTDGYYHLDVSSQVWAVSPWANNVLHGIAAVFAGEEARPAANLVWLLVGVNGAWRLAKMAGASTPSGLAAAAAYATLPLTGYFTTAMQVDGASAAVLMQLAASIVAAGRSLPPAMAMAVMFGLLAGLKATNAVYALPAVAWLAWTALRHRDIRWLAAVAGTTVLLAGASYFYATLVTGNPVFPLFNALFKSPYYPSVDFIDTRWLAGVNWRFLWDATVHTDRFGEVYPGAWGFALLALLPALVLGVVSEARIRWIAAWFLFAGIVVFAQVQYVRYLFPALAGLVVLGVASLGREGKRPMFAAATIILVAGNALLLPTTSWMARENPWSELLRSGRAASDGIAIRMAPARVLVQRVLAADADACILIADADEPYIAVAGGQAQSTKGSYDPRMAKSFGWAAADATGGRWPGFLMSVGASHVVAGPANDTAFTNALVTAGYAIQYRAGGLSVWAAADPLERQCKGNLEEARDEAHRRLHPGDAH